jgi:enediyne biosynthesis protein E4
MPKLLISLLLLAYFNTFSQAKFEDVSKTAGIDHQFIVLQGSFGGGAVAFDYNNDGFEDLFISGGKADDMLYLNKGNGTFENVYEKSGLKTAIKYISQGAVSADVNKDGWRDLFIVTINSSANKEKVPRAINLLFINNGNGTFRDATTEYHLDKFYSFSTAAMFGDVNNDGYPDIYVGNYFKEFAGKLNLLNDAEIVGSKQSAKGYLLINKEGKYFEDEYDKYGLTHKGFGFGGVFSDFDNDGDLDLQINHDFGYKNTPNKFYENKYPDEEFVEIGDKIKMDLPINAMGTAVGDYNGDGLMDYFITNIRTNYFMVNQGVGKPFINLSDKLGTRVTKITDSSGVYHPVSWGANFADFDNDGDLDLFVSNGCTNPVVEPIPDYYFENVNDQYKNASVSSGINNKGIGRGSIVFDYDNDGDLDILLINQNPADENFPNAPKSALYRNDSPQKNWIKIALTGINSDKNGIGSKVEVVVGDKRMYTEIDGGSSHASQNSVIAHFGLGNNDHVDTIRIHWLGGGEQILVNQKANQLIKITEKPSAKNKFNYWWLAIIPAAVILFYFLKQRKANVPAS